MSWVLSPRRPLAAGLVMPQLTARATWVPDDLLAHWLRTDSGAFWTGLVWADQSGTQRWRRLARFGPSVRAAT